MGNQAVEQLAAKGTVKKAADDFIVEGRMEGASARQLSRALISLLRKVEKKTTLRPERTSVGPGVAAILSAASGTRRRRTRCWQR
ncbi:MAG: hypothetical protein ABSF98_23915 [Bryobacteraceae bacterium]